jgi:hypothetical protein
MTEALRQSVVQGPLISNYQVFSPGKDGKTGIEIGFAEKYERELFYRLQVISPEKNELFIMPGNGGMQCSFKVFAAMRDLKGKFLGWSPVGSGDWSYDRKGIYLSIKYPEANYLIILEPSNFPFWQVDTRKAGRAGKSSLKLTKKGVENG